MLGFAFGVYFVCALMIAALAAKYFFGPAPADYHLEIMGVSRDTLDPRQVTVFSAVYRVMGAAFFSLALALAFLAWFAIAADFFWAKLAAPVIGLAGAGPAFWVTFNVHKETGVETPWKPAVAVIILLVIGFLASVV